MMRLGHNGKEPDVQLCVQADAGTGSSFNLAVRPARLNTALDFICMIAAISIRKSRIGGLTALLLLVILGYGQALLSGSEDIRKEFKEVPNCGVDKFDASMENPLWMRHQLKSGAESEFSVVMWEMCEGKYAGYVERFPGRIVLMLTTPSHLSSREPEAEIVFCQCLHKFVFSFVGPVEPSEEVVLVTRGIAVRIEPDEV